MDGAGLGQGQLSADRLPGCLSTTPRRSRSDGPKSLDEVDPELLQDLREARHSAARAGGARRRRGRCGVRQRLGRHHLQGEARRARHHLLLDLARRCSEHPELVRKYLGTVVPLCATISSPRSTPRCSPTARFVYIPQGRALPDGAVDLFPHQRRQDRPVRAHADHRRRGQPMSAISKAAPRRCATRTSCTPRWSSWSRSTMPRSSTRPCRTGIPATRRARAASTISSPSAAPAAARNSKISWTQVETGSAITWKYPSCILQGDNSVGEFYSVAVTNNRQQADTGTKMIHIGKNTRSTIISKGISAGHGAEHLSRPGAHRCRGPTGARNYTQCDSLLLGDNCGAHTVPYIESEQPHRAGRARGDDLEDQRRPAVLLPPARPVGRRTRCR